MKLESRIDRLVRTLQALRTRRAQRGARSLALNDLRIIGDWLCSGGDEPRLIRRRPSLLERNLSRIASSIYRSRNPRSPHRIFVRFMSMSRALGRSLFPNQILINPQLCGDPGDLVLAFCHEMAHHTRGIEYQHDRVFEGEFEKLCDEFGARIYQVLARSLGAAAKPRPIGKQR